MAEYNKQRYYWIKLTDKFMTSDTVDFLMSQKDGANYVILYQMLCLKTVNNDGQLARTLGEIIVPYDEEKIQRDTKWFSIDTIRVAMNLYRKLGLIYEQENGTLRISNFENMIGSQTVSAYKKQIQIENRGGTKVEKIPPDIDIEKEIEIEKEIIINNNKETNIDADAVFDRMLKEMEQLVPAISFETFFKNLKHKRINEDKLVLSASGLIANAIDGRYKDKLDGAIAKASNGEIIGYEWEVEI